MPKGRRVRTYRVLILMREPAHASAAQLALMHGAYAVSIARTIREAKTLLVDRDPDLALIDLDVDDGAGMELVRKRSRRLPIIAMTRNGELAAKLKAFDRGADDLLNIPFLPEELIARAQALIRRTYVEGIDLIAVVRLGDIAVDILKRTVTVGTRRMDLSPLELGLFWLLASNAGVTVSKRDLEEMLWGTEIGTSSNVVEQYVRRLRDKLGEDARRPRYIRTIRGKGYQFSAT